MANSQIPIQLIEDDVALAHSISGLLTTLDHACTHHKSAEDFLAQIQANPQALTLTSCIITDVRLPNMSGIELLSCMKEKYKECVWPIIIITGHGDIAMAVDALDKGAIGFLTKPFDPYALADKVNWAIEKSVELKKINDFRADFQNHFKQLTDQEKTILDRLLADLSSREIAEQLGNSTRTIEVHRASIFKKMGVNSLMQLAQLNERYEMLSKSES